MVEWQWEKESRNARRIRQAGNCITTNVMHRFFIYLSKYFCLTCFGLSFSSSSEAGVQLRGADTIPRRYEPLPKLYTCLWRWAKRKPETGKAEVNRYINYKLVHYVGHCAVSIPIVILLSHLHLCLLTTSKLVIRAMYPAHLVLTDLMPYLGNVN
jgi:hypothetical protein